MTAVTETIYPHVRHPYYIVAPPYTRRSAGVCVLHLLCHSLNRLGQTAYIIVHPSLPWQRDQLAPDLLTPILTPAILRRHFDEGLTPITLYPEIFKGNPFHSPAVVRYVMNFPGLLGGDATYAPDELCFSYSKILAATTNAPDNVLFLPATDTRIFYPPPLGQKRQGSCFYGHKYQHAYKGSLLPITSDSVEITRDQPDSQTPQQIADLFRRSEVFYAYENTALAIEAVLCGCPAVFLPNPYLTEMIAAKELGPEGYAWGADPAAIERARDTVAIGAANYLKSYETYWRDLEHFIAMSQAHAEGKAYDQPMRLPRLTDVAAFLLQRGLGSALRRVAQKIRN